MECTVIRGNDLERVVWYFRLNATYFESIIRCTKYVHEKRPTKQHKWKQVRSWNRASAPEDTLECIFPLDVADEARDKLSEMVCHLAVC